MIRKIRFQGSEFLLIGSLEKGGAIATEDQYTEGRCSSAHLDKEGIIRSFGMQIGTREEIEDLGEADKLQIDPAAILNVIDAWETRLWRK